MIDLSLLIRFSYRYLFPLDNNCKNSYNYTWIIIIERLITKTYVEGEKL